ncbi:hypothetical protein QBC39DRAFT_346166 [Podospora conica]|nr:hypothetical protein QBC39DRAFT_346166 [Schizothecium conicum]
MFPSNVKTGSLESISVSRRTRNHMARRGPPPPRARHRHRHRICGGWDGAAPIRFVSLRFDLRAIFFILAKVVAHQTTLRCCFPNQPAEPCHWVVCAANLYIRCAPQRALVPEGDGWGLAPIFGDGGFFDSCKCVSYMYAVMKIRTGGLLAALVQMRRSVGGELEARRDGGYTTRAIPLPSLVLPFAIQDSGTFHFKSATCRVMKHLN